MVARDILKDPPLYTTRFTATARTYSPSAAETGEVRASIERLKPLLPEGIDPAASPTILYVVGNLFVGHTVNLNSDAVTLEDTIRMYPAFEGQQINVEHNRGSIAGYIVRAGLAEYGTDRLITEEEALAAGKPVNVAVVVALWKVVERELVQYIAQAGSEVSLSFEVGFDSYSVVVMPKGVMNLAMAKQVIPPSDPAYDSWTAKLRVNKGAGTSRGDTVGRILLWPIIPMGGGIVAQPAGAVKGLAPILSREVDVTMAAADEAGAGMYSHSSTQCTLGAEAAAPFLAYAATIPDDHLYHGEDSAEAGRYGRESEPHVTCCYGIVGNDAAPLQTLLANWGKPIMATLGKVMAFENADKPYDVLIAEVVSEDLHALHALIKASCEVESSWPSYTPHATISYLRKGLAAQYVGDTRFEGTALTFPSLTFSPAEGSRTDILLYDQPTIPPIAVPASIAASDGTAQTQPPLVYSPSDPCDLGSSMASTPTKTLKLSMGWQIKLAQLTKDVGEAGLKHGIDVLLSDGRAMKGMRVLSAAELGSDIECSYDGCVILSMTPGVAAPEYMPPGKDDIYPTVDAVQRAKDAAEMAQQKVAQNAGYTGASVTEQAVEAALSEINKIFKLDQVDRTFSQTLFKTARDTQQASAGVSASTAPRSTPLPMDLTTLKQAVAAVKTVEDLPTVMANVASFVDILAAASAEQVKAKETAEKAVAITQASLAEVQAQLAALQTAHDQLVASQQAAAAEQTFQSRMTAIADVFVDDDSFRADILPEIKACADEAAFAGWMTRAKRLYKGYLKTAAASAPGAAVAGENPFKKDEDKEKEDSDKCKAAAVAALQVAAANVVDAPVSNTLTLTPKAKTLAEQYAETFAKHTSIGGERVSVLAERAKTTVKKTV